MARKRFEFWLNDQRQEDWQVYELIGKLKKPAKGQGQFTRAIREGLRLWTSLRDGQVDVLLELFPWVSEALTKSAAAPVAGGGGHSDLAKEIAAQIVLMGGTPGYLMQSSAAPAPPASNLRASRRWPHRLRMTLTTCRRLSSQRKQGIPPAITSCGC